MPAMSWVFVGLTNGDSRQFAFYPHTQKYNPGVCGEVRGMYRLTGIAAGLNPNLNL